MFTAWNQGKRSVVLDLKADGDRAVAHRLIESADVLVENFRPGVADRLGVGAEALIGLNRRLVTVTSPGYGADESMASAPAFDPLMQALGGIMEAQGGDDEPVFLTVAVHDVLTPLLSAFGAVAALYHRQRCGVASRVRTSLAQTTAAAQAAELTRFEGAAPPLRGGWDFPGPSEDRRWVTTPDGGFEFVDGTHRVRVARDGLINEPVALDNGIVVEADYPGLGPLTQFGQLIEGAGDAPAPAPELDADAVLRTGPSRSAS
jgi:crotonobetainyl-CoA:carnitine CoA-transferase CaiB-like acyl-CoA transferase